MFKKTRLVIIYNTILELITGCTSRIQARHSRFSSFRRLSPTIIFISAQHVSTLSFSQVCLYEAACCSTSQHKNLRSKVLSVPNTSSTELSSAHIRNTNHPSVFKLQLKSFFFRKAFCETTPLHLASLRICSSCCCFPGGDFLVFSCLFCRVFLHVVE